MNTKFKAFLQENLFTHGFLKTKNLQVFWEPVSNSVVEIPQIFNYVRNKFPRVPNNTFNVCQTLENKLL
jgi:hypothetical protein